MRNEYEQDNDICVNYIDSQCTLEDYQCTCVICKGQFCRRYKEDVNECKRDINILERQ